MKYTSKAKPKITRYNKAELRELANSEFEITKEVKETLLDKIPPS